MKYVLNNLECLQKGSYCVAIVPMSCAIATSQDRNKSIYNLKKELLEKHTLDAVFSMPDELFVNSKVGTVTCVMIFKAKEKHPLGYKTYFAYCKDDGFVKKRTGRTDYYNKWQDIKKAWVSAYRNRDEVKYHSIKKSVTADDEWCAEAYLPTNYSKISEDMFIQKLKNYCLYLFSNRLSNSISVDAKNNVKNDQNKKFSLFKIDDYFDVFSGGDKPNKDDYDEDNGELVNSVENQVVNNGIKEQIYFDKKDKIFQNFISVVSIGAGGTSFYQPEKCSCFTRVKALLPKDNVKFNPFVALYLCVIIDLEKFRYGYGRVVSKDRLAETKLYLPIDNNNKPDWDYMEQYIKSLPYSCNI